jgi:hypothetical protein
MSALTIELDQGRRTYRPGEVVSGRARWTLVEPAPARVLVRLFWRTSGRGTEDLEIIEEVRFDAPAARESRPFRFTLPEGPYGFSGKLISVIWGIELVVEPGDASTNVELVVGPRGREITLVALEEPQK